MLTLPMVPRGTLFEVSQYALTWFLEGSLGPPIVIFSALKFFAGIDSLAQPL